MPTTQFGMNDAVREGDVAHYQVSFVDVDDQIIQDGDVSAITATLTVYGTGQILNGRNAQNVLNANGGTLSSGVFTLVLGAADNISVGTDTIQSRRLVLVVTYTGGTLTHEVIYYVQPDETFAPASESFLSLRRRVLRRLDQLEELSTGSQLEELVKEELNEANNSRVTEYPWPFLRVTTTLTLTGAQRYPLPRDLNRLLLIWNPADRQYCQKVPDRMLETVGIGFDGTIDSSLYMPFTIEGSTLVFYTVPTATTLTLVYYRGPSLMTEDDDTSQIPWPHTSLLVWDALIALKAYAKELEEIPVWTRFQQRAEQRLYQTFCEGQTLGEVAQMIHPGTERR